MNRSQILLTAFAVSSAALLSVETQEAKAMNIAFDCFERSSEKLVARSAVDITSTTISCLPVPGTTLAENSKNESDDDDMIVDNTGRDEDFGMNDNSDADITDGDITYEDEDIYEEETNSASSTGSQLGEALGKHIGNLLVKGVNDLFR